MSRVLHYVRQSRMVLLARLFVLQLLVTIVHLVIRPAMLFLGAEETDLVGVPSYWLIILGVQLINFLMVLLIIARWLAFKYVIEEEEVRIFSGVFHRKKTRYGAKNLEQIHHEQSLWGRIFGYGDVVAYNPVLAKNIVLRAIPRPEFYANILEKIQEESQNLAGGVNIIRN